LATTSGESGYPLSPDVFVWVESEVERRKSKVVMGRGVALVMVGRAGADGYVCR
jgi:hypothetical protein